MKTRISIWFVFAALGLTMQGCGPETRITGMVLEDQTGTPIPGAAVLAMVWVEETDKARPVPVVEALEPEVRDAAYNADMKDRGLPTAYARAFSDSNGRFTLDKPHFSAETEKAVKAMKQPKITRITLNVFQRGYIKHAATVFPKGVVQNLPPATIIISRPASWKQLALDNYFRTLRRDEYDFGYSKEFGATKEEKDWFLKYTYSNLDKAYAESNIKGDKQWEEDCGHDYSDIIISTSGIQRNPKHEKCNVLLHQMGVLRDWEEEWLNHAVTAGARQTPAVSAIKSSLDQLGPEYAEVKANEFHIIAGVNEAETQRGGEQADINLRNGLNESKTGTAEAQRLYNTGDKAGAYRALGRALSFQLPEEARQGLLTAQLTIKTIPGIIDTAAGFYLLMNRPQTAQLPGGDGGNHNDKLGVKESTEAIKIGEEEIGIQDSVIRFIDGKGGLRRKILLDTLKTIEKAKTNEGKEIEIEITRTKTPVIAKNKKYVLINAKVHKIPADRKRLWEYGYFETNKITLYGIDGTLLYEKQFPENAGFPNGRRQIAVSDTGIVALIAESGMDKGTYWTKLYAYDKTGTLILTYPDDKTIIDIYTDDINISPNGRYLAVRVGFPYQERIVMVFFDLKKKTWWEAKRSYVVHYITDNGVARISYPNPKIPANAIREQVKEPLIIGEELDLTKHLGE